MIRLLLVLLVGVVLGRWTARLRVPGWQARDEVFTVDLLRRVLTRGGE